MRTSEMSRQAAVCVTLCLWASWLVRPAVSAESSNVGAADKPTARVIP